MANILYLTYDGLTDPLGQSQVLPYILGLEKKGHNFHIISFEKPEAFRINQSEIHELLVEKSIQWHPLLYHKNPPILSTLYDLRKMKKKALGVVNEEKIEIVHCRSYMPGLVGMSLKSIVSTKFLFDIRGFWVNERVDGGIWNLKNPIFRLVYDYMKAKEVKLMEESDHIISLTHAGKDEIVNGNLFNRKGIRIDQAKITVIPCAVDLELFNNKDLADHDVMELRRELKLGPNDKIIMYLGSVGTWYLLEEMLSFFKKWNEKYHDFKMVFITRDDPGMILQIAYKMNIEEDLIRVHPSPRTKIPKYLKLADCGLFFIKQSFSKQASSATKMGEMLAMHLPFITNKGIGDADFLIEKYNCGITIDLMDRGLDLDNIDFSNLKFEKVVTEYFSLTKGIDNYNSVYRQLS